MLGKGCAWIDPKSPAEFQVVIAKLTAGRGSQCPRSTCTRLVAEDGVEDEEPEEEEEDEEEEEEHEEEEVARGEFGMQC
jgi:ribosomal protein L12E/L44/L45/RPP1/RPP2